MEPGAAARDGWGEQTRRTDEARYRRGQVSYIHEQRAGRSWPKTPSLAGAADQRQHKVERGTLPVHHELLHVRTLSMALTTPSSMSTTTARACSVSTCSGPICTSSWPTTLHTKATALLADLARAKRRAASWRRNAASRCAP